MVPNLHPGQDHAGGRGGHRQFPQRLAVALRFSGTEEEGLRRGWRLGSPTSWSEKHSPPQGLGGAGGDSRGPRWTCLGSGVSKGTRVSPRPRWGLRNSCPRWSPTQLSVRPPRILAARPGAAEAHPGPGVPRRLPAVSSPPGSASRVRLATGALGEIPQPGGARSPRQEADKAGSAEPRARSSRRVARARGGGAGSARGPGLRGARRGQGRRGRQN